MMEFHPGQPPRSGCAVIDRKVPSRPDCKSELITGIMAEMIDRQAWVLEDDAHWLELCLEEVVVNAMLHGNQGDPNLDISCELYDDGDRWILLIGDQGEGFNQLSIPDPDDPSSLLLEHGRGILLMVEWLDELKYYRNGRCAWLSRRQDTVQS